MFVSDTHSPILYEELWQTTPTKGSLKSMSLTFLCCDVYFLQPTRLLPNEPPLMMSVRGSNDEDRPISRLHWFLVGGRGPPPRLSSFLHMASERKAAYRATVAAACHQVHAAPPLQGLGRRELLERYGGRSKAVGLARRAPEAATLTSAPTAIGAVAAEVAAADTVSSVVGSYDNNGNDRDNNTTGSDRGDRNPIPLSSQGKVHDATDADPNPDAAADTATTADGDGSTVSLVTEGKEPQTEMSPLEAASPPAEVGDDAKSGASNSDAHDSKETTGGTASSEIVESVKKED
ncbi:hypothetical protein BX600DRAFT_534808 [Xylariales sp. PMI_506]|nr:hypothetical protein BX600DRAFT_534808 [Xylariales sp. PMI_506]